MTERVNLELYLVTDRAWLRGRTLVQIVEAAIDGGVTAVQLREKSLDTRTFLAEARALKQLLAPRGIPLLINDRVDIALACDADGVHLGQTDMPVEDVRRLMPNAIIGLSVETMEHVHEASALPVDYLGVSPIYATPTKTDTAAPWGLDGLRAIKAATRLPLVAIGGIHPENAAPIRALAGLAVVSAICAADDPRAAAATLRTA